MKNTSVIVLNAPNESLLWVAGGVLIAAIIFYVWSNKSVKKNPFAFPILVLSIFLSSIMIVNFFTPVENSSLDKMDIVRLEENWTCGGKSDALWREKNNDTLFKGEATSVQEGDACIVTLERKPLLDNKHKENEMSKKWKAIK